MSVTIVQPERSTVLLEVPGLVERPAVGTSCCASTAEAIVAQELSMLPGVEDLGVDLEAAEVTITFRPDRVEVSDLAAALEEIGYPPTL